MERRHKAEQTGFAYELLLQHVVNRSKQTSEVSMRSRDVVRCALNVFSKEIEYAKLVRTHYKRDAGHDEDGMITTDGRVIVIEEMLGEHENVHVGEEKEGTEAILYFLLLFFYFLSFIYIIGSAENWPLLIWSAIYVI